MTEKLTLDQKIEIAKIAGNLTAAAMSSAGKVSLIHMTSEPLRSPHYDTLFKELYEAIEDTVTNSPA